MLNRSHYEEDRALLIRLIQNNLRPILNRTDNFFYCFISVEIGGKSLPNI